MDMWYHFLVGILIQASFLRFFGGGPVIWVLILITAFFSHFIVDWGSYLTFHPDETYRGRHPEDRFFTIRTVISGIAAAAVAIYFSYVPEPGFFLVMLASWLVDFVDWIVVRNLIKIHLIDEKYFHEGVLHRIINQFREKVAWWLPNWREKKAASIMEFVLAAPVIIGLILIL